MVGVSVGESVVGAEASVVVFKRLGNVFISACVDDYGLIYLKISALAHPCLVVLRQKDGLCPASARGRSRLPFRVHAVSCYLMLLLLKIRIGVISLQLRFPSICCLAILLLDLACHFSNIAHASLEKGAHHAFTRIWYQLLNKGTPGKEFLMASACSF